nr:phospholipase [Wenjunlia tyrosinilytica]
MTTTVLTAFAGVAAGVGPVGAAPSDKPQVLADWTRTGAGSFNAWNSARQNQGAWAAYGFDWSTDYCTSSPDNPLGFRFRLPCARHDFGYRNYKAAGTFGANKDRIDSAFYEDLKRVCAKLRLGASRTACNSTAWTYYQAVRVFGITDDGSRPHTAAH